MRAPLEDCEAAGAIKLAGGLSRVLDAPAAHWSDERFLAEIDSFRPDLIVLATTFATLDADLAWAARLRDRFPTAAIGVRGAPCYVMDVEILSRSAAVDFCVQGEYEIVFDDIVRWGIQRARGVTYRKGGAIVRPADVPKVEDLDSLPWADRTAIDPSLYTVRGIGEPQATVRVQRGCPYPCTYCLVHTVSGNKARHRSPRSIANEVTQILESGISSVYFRAETFSLDREWALAVCRELERYCPGVRWVTTTRIERVDDELLGAMRAAGCYGVSFGMDVASPEIAKHVRKLASLETAQRAMRLCDKHRLISLGYLMTGFIWDNEDTLRCTEDFIVAVRPDLLTIHFAHPYPGTVYYEQFQKAGGEVLSKFAQAEPAGDGLGLSAAEFESRSRAILRRHYTRPKVLASLARKGIPLLTEKLLRVADAAVVDRTLGPRPLRS